jgi:hypothetical protein
MPAMAAKAKQQQALHAAAANLKDVTVCVTNGDRLSGYYAYQSGQNEHTWYFGDEPESENLRIKFEKRTPFYRLLSNTSMTGYLNRGQKKLDIGFVLGWTMTEHYHSLPNSSTADAAKRISQLPSNVPVEGAEVIGSPQALLGKNDPGTLSEIATDSANNLSFVPVLVPASSTVYVYNTGNTPLQGNYNTSIQNPSLYELAAVFVAVDPGSLKCR